MAARFERREELSKLGRNIAIPDGVLGGANR
jgi:hypothetical protein